MDERTGAVARFETTEDAEQAGYQLPLSDKQARLLSGMNRQERRKWAVEERARRKAERLRK